MWSLQEDADEYAFQEDEDDEEVNGDDFDGSSRRGNRQNGRRSSGRNGSSNEWRGERRSSRLGVPETQLDERPTKRARTEESSVSAVSTDGPTASSSAGDSISAAKNGAPAKVKPTEIAMEQIPGKKKSKFWFYAVEPRPGHVLPPPSDTDPLSSSNGAGTPIHLQNGSGGDMNGHGSTTSMDIDDDLDGSLSPVSMDSDS